jgi:hypothetical protein
MLPAVLDDEGTDSWLRCEKLMSGNWRVSYVDDGNEEDGNEPPTEASTEADAAGEDALLLAGEWTHHSINEKAPAFT